MLNLESLQTEIENRLAAHHEWLLIDAAGRSFALKRPEIEIENRNHKILVGFLDERGFQIWRVEEFCAKGEEIILQLSQNFAKNREKIRLVPRALAKDLSASVDAARLEKARRIARLVKENFPRLKLARVSLNQENGRFACFTAVDPSGRRFIALSDVTGSLTPEILLSAACLRLRKLSARKVNPIASVWILGESKEAQRLQKLHALLRPDWQSRILIKEISRDDAHKEGGATIRDLETLKISDLWRAKAKTVKLPPAAPPGEISRKIVALAPAEIDAVFSRNGETLRFRGLPFARVRRALDEEKVWFGAEKSIQILTNENWNALQDLIENLALYRRFDAPNRRHAFYRDAPEAWLEAVLRRNIKMLDANLILSPLYHQFRAGRERVDLLALRRDGRLVIIELKVATDREMVFQAADYWRRIEAERRAGNLARARLFGDRQISDRPAICYAVAPTLSFHRDFDFLVETLAPEIEIHRFGLNENWREELRVLRRR